MKKRAIILEITVIFLAINCANYLFFGKDLGFLQFKLSPYWIIVILMAGRYGIYAGFLSGTAACANVLLFIFKKVPTKPAIEQLMESGDFVVPLAFILAGILIGAIRQGFMEKEGETSRALKEKEGALKQLSKKYDTMEKTQRVLEARIVGATTTVKTLYLAAQKIETLDAASIYSGCLEILTTHFQVEKASLYLREGSYYVLKASYGWAEGEAVEGKIPAENSMMEIAFSENRTVTIKDILAKEDSNKYLAQYGQVLAMVPLRGANDAPMGVVNIEKMDFLNFTRPNIELVGLVVDWVGRALHNKRLYDMARSEGGRVMVSGIYTYPNFAPVLESEFLRAGTFGLGLALAVIKIDGYGFYDEKKQKMAREIVVKLLRRYMADTDMIFKYGIEGMFAAISPMRKRGDVTESFDKIKNELNKINEQDKTGSLRIGITAGSSEVSPGVKESRDLLNLALKDLSGKK